MRFLLWASALLTPRPPELMVLNEPEISLHPDLLPDRRGTGRRGEEDCAQQFALATWNEQWRSTARTFPKAHCEPPF